VLGRRQPCMRHPHAPQSFIGEPFSSGLHDQPLGAQRFGSFFPYGTLILVRRQPAQKVEGKIRSSCLLSPAF
jgi:hypothetical protein